MISSRNGFAHATHPCLHNYMQHHWSQAQNLIAEVAAAAAAAFTPADSEVPNGAGGDGT